LEFCIYIYIWFLKLIIGTRGNAGEVITNECNPSKLTGTGCKF